MSKIPGFAFDGSGTVKKIDVYTSRAGKDIITLVIFVDGKYPAEVPVKFFGRAADEARKASEGDTVEITGKLGGREWNGKVYGDIIGETVEVVGGVASDDGDGSQPSSEQPPSDSIPF